jgi:hypothetical protein
MSISILIVFPFGSTAAMLSDVCLPFDDFNAARVTLEICGRRSDDRRPCASGY